MAANAPILIRFATDTASAKSGMQDLAASIAGNMIKVSGAVARHVEALDAAAAANGGYAATAKTLASSVVHDFGSVASAGMKAANDSNVSAIAIGAAMGKAAVQTQAGSVIMQGGWAAAKAGISAQSAIIRNEISATWQLLSSSPAFKAGVGIIAGVAGIAAAIALTNAAVAEAKARLEDLVKIGASAQTVGVGTTFLQGWIGQAKELNTEVGKLQSMLERARHASTTTIGEGNERSTSPIQDRLKQNVKAGNLSQADANRFDDAKGQEQKIRVILDLVEQLRAKGMQLAAFDLAGKMFGPDFEEKLRSGVDMTGKMRIALDGMKVSGGKGIVPPEEIAKAQEITATFDRASTILATAMLPIMKDIHAWEQQQLADWADMVLKISKVTAAVLSLYEAVKSVAGVLDRFTGKDPLGSLATSLGAGRVREALGLPVLGEEAYGAPDESSRNKSGARAPEQLPQITINGDRSHSLPSLSTPKGGSGSKEADPVETYIGGLEKATAALKAETEAYGKSNAEKQEAVALAKAMEIAKQNDVTLSDEQIARIKATATASGELKDKLANLEQAARQNAEAMRAFGEAGVNALSDMIFEGKSFDEVMKNLAKTLAKQALQGLMMGTGPLAGLLGTAAPASAGPNAQGGLLGLISEGVKGMTSGGFRANGGDMQAGKAYTVGELGQEIFVPGQDGRMVPINRNGGGFGGGTMSVPITINEAPGVQTTVSRGPGGITIDQATRSIEGSLAKRAYRGQGPLASPIANAGMRTG